jgi:hypothetical protein
LFVKLNSLKALVVTAHKQKPQSLAKANAICAFAYLQNVKQVAETAIYILNLYRW